MFVDARDVESEAELPQRGTEKLAESKPGTPSIRDTDVLDDRSRMCNQHPGWAASDRLLGAVGAAIVGGVSILVYVAALALLRAPELAIAQRTVRRMLGR